MYQISMETNIPVGVIVWRMCNAQESKLSLFICLLFLTINDIPLSTSVGQGYRNDKLYYTKSTITCDKYYSVEDIRHSCQLCDITYSMITNTCTFLLMVIPLTWPETHLVRACWISVTHFFI